MNNSTKDNQSNITTNNQNNSIQDAVIIIDMNKFPEEIREKLPKDLQDKLIEMFQSDYQSLEYDKNKNTHDNITHNKTIQHTTKEDMSQEIKSSELFAIQQGYVVGNIYKDNIQKE